MMLAQTPTQTDTHPPTGTKHERTLTPTLSRTPTHTHTQVPNMNTHSHALALLQGKKIKVCRLQCEQKRVKQEKLLFLTRGTHLAGRQSTSIERNNWDVLVS